MAPDEAPAPLGAVGDVLVEQVVGAVVQERSCACSMQQWRRRHKEEGVGGIATRLRTQAARDRCKQL